MDSKVSRRSVCCDLSTAFLRNASTVIYLYSMVGDCIAFPNLRPLMNKHGIFLYKKRKLFDTFSLTHRPWGYITWVQYQAQNKGQWLAACGHVSASSQSLRFILSLRMNSNFITSMPGSAYVIDWYPTCIVRGGRSSVTLPDIESHGGQNEYLIGISIQPYVYICWILWHLNLLCSWNSYILTDFNYATLTSPCIFQKTVECKLSLLWLCHHELASSANTLV